MAELTKREKEAMDLIEWQLNAIAPDVEEREKRAFEQVERELAEAERQEELLRVKPYIERAGKELGAAAHQIKRIPEIWGEEARAGWEAMQKAGILGKIGGAAQYTFSPLTGVTRGLAGEPVETVTGSELAGTAAEMGLEALVFGAPTKYIKEFTRLPGQRLGAAEIGKQLKNIRIPLKDVILEPVELKSGFREWSQKVTRMRLDRIRGGDPHFEKVLRQSIQDKITQVAESALAGKTNEAKRIFRQVQDHLEMGDIFIDDIPDILKRHNLNPAEFAMFVADDVSRAGKTLWYYSRLAKSLNYVFKDSPDAAKILDAAISKFEPSFMDNLARAWLKMDTPRRAALVGQVATAMRNAWSQLGRISIATFDETLQGIFGGGKGYKEGINTLNSIWNTLTPAGRARLNKTLKDFPISYARLFRTPVHEIGVGSRVAHVVNTLNRTQEYFFRRLAFQAKLNQLLKKAGMDWGKVNPKKIPTEMISEAVDYALEMTYAATPKSQFGKELLRTWSRFPGLTTIQPFPRFNYFNALPFLLEHSPLGYIKALSPKTLKLLAAGDPTKFAKAASRATIGTLLFESAWHIRQSDYAGERWYEVKVGEPDPKTGEQRVIDLRAYAPLSTYLFMAEVFVHPERIKPIDWFQSMFGLSRIAGTGLILVDVMRARRGETLAKTGKRFVGEYLGGYTIPLRSLKDLMAGVEPEEGIYRDIRVDPFTAPFLQNIPRISRLLPEAISPVKEERVRAEAPVLRQLTGLSIKVKNLATQELDKLGLDWTSAYPRTGNAEADREISAYMAPIVNRFMPFVLGNTNYRKESLAGKRVIMKLVFRTIRELARQQMSARNPLLAALVKSEQFNEDEAKLIEEKTGLRLDEMIQGWRTR